MATMTSKFDGTCKRCGGRFAAGTVINWTKGYGATHVEQTACDASVAARTTQTPIDPAGIVAFLTGARQRGLKFPKARFLGPNGRELRISLAGASSKNPGAIYVKLNDEYQGLVQPDGGSRGYLSRDPVLLGLLAIIAAEPARLAKEYGALMGACSFCNLPLTDAGSVEVGYGPVCAKHYGLPHKPKGTVAVAVPAALPVLVHDEGSDAPPASDWDDRDDSDQPEPSAEPDTRPGWTLRESLFFPA